MRAVAAIIVAVMSVTTGGPLRCPCQLAAFFRTGPQTCALPPAPKACQEKNCCPCHSHDDAPTQEQESPKPSPQAPPCPHGQGIDLAPPLTSLDREVGGVEHGAPAVATAPLGLFSVPPGGPSVPVDPNAHSTPPPDHLRYCHSFRC